MLGSKVGSTWEWHGEHGLQCTHETVGHRTAASAGELDTVGGKQEHRNKLNANSCDTVGFGAA